MKQYKVLDIDLNLKYNITAKSLSIVQKKLADIIRPNALEFITENNRLVSIEIHLDKDSKYIKGKDLNNWLSKLDYYLFHDNKSFKNTEKYMLADTILLLINLKKYF